MKATIRPILLLFTALSLTIGGCKKDADPAPEKAKPTISDIEIGTANNERGTIGRDFHFNAEVVAGDKLENVNIAIQQRAGETYSKTWSFNLTWEEYKGVKNATIHKHFTIPADAAPGKYNFIIVVKDQNGTSLETTRAITLVLP